MRIRERAGASRRLRRALGRASGYFQQTFQTPLQQLELFAGTQLSAHSPLESGSITLEQVVFAPTNLQALLAAHSLPPTSSHDWIITATGETEIVTLLEAAWTDSVDFYFTPIPKRYHLFADHDEYTTILGARQDQVAQVATAFEGAGFSRVEGYEREW